MAAKGILGRKLGMTQLWDADNRIVPVTVIAAGPCHVVQLKTPERDGYSAVQLSFGEVKPRRLNKPELGHLRKADAAPSQHLAELRVDDLSGFEIGQIVRADLFGAGDLVDVTGISKGKGFSGVMKRHNFKGQGASHGNHKKHRAPGSIGASASAPRRPGCSRARAWPATTATNASPRSTSRWSRAMRSGACCSYVARSRARPAPSCSCATR